MVDRRTRRQKLEAMAADRSSPNEAAIARAMLDQEGSIKRVGRKTRPRLEFDPDMQRFWARYFQNHIFDEWDGFPIPSGPDRPID
jgi:hypothetical protein